MDWRVKVLGHWIVSVIPPLRYSLQRHVTKSFPRDDESFRNRTDAAARHVALAERHLGSCPRLAFEFGAGWDLIVPMAMSRRIREQTVTDVSRLARPELIADTARRLGVSEDLSALGIRYLAPIDASATGLPAHSFDLVYSTDTLEHVPRKALGPLLIECGRLLRPGGVLTALVDYTDHYSHADRSLPTFNFLRFDERTWRVLNPPSHYQSRIRHPELVEVMDGAGFRILESDCTHVEDEVATAWIVATPKPRQLVA